MTAYTAHVTPRDGIVRQHRLSATSLQSASAAVRRLATKRYGAGFTYSVRPA